MFEIELNQIFTILFRITLALLLAFIPGMERELTGKFAGLRTHLLVCLGACVFTILSLYGFQTTNSIHGVLVQDDPARIAAQVITGIGFIGAGTVMRHGSNVSGITTAATLWVCAAIGMSCGCGAYLTASCAAVATSIVLISVRQLERKVLSKRKVSYKIYEITLNSSMDECDDIQNIVESNFHKIFKVSRRVFNKSELCFSALISTKKSLKEMNELFSGVNTLKSIDIKEHYD